MKSTCIDRIHWAKRNFFAGKAWSDHDALLWSYDTFVGFFCCVLHSADSAGRIQFSKDRQRWRHALVGFSMIFQHGCMLLKLIKLTQPHEEITHTWSGISPKRNKTAGLCVRFGLQPGTSWLRCVQRLLHTGQQHASGTISYGAWWATRQTSSNPKLWQSAAGSRLSDGGSLGGGMGFMSGEVNGAKR